MKIIKAFLLLFLLGTNLPIFARPSYMQIYNNDSRALNSQKNNCGICHINPSGGGARNKFGNAFENANFMITDALVQEFSNLFKSDSGSSSSSSGSPTALAPEVLRVKPSTFPINKSSKLIIKGKNFSSSSKVLIDNSEVTTTFKSTVKLFANFILNNTGSHSVKVKNPDGQESNIVNIIGK